MRAVQSRQPFPRGRQPDHPDPRTGQCELLPLRRGGPADRRDRPLGRQRVLRVRCRRQPVHPDQPARIRDHLRLGSPGPAHAPDRRGKQHHLLRLRRCCTRFPPRLGTHAAPAGCERGEPTRVLVSASPCCGAVKAWSLGLVAQGTRRQPTTSFVPKGRRRASCALSRHARVGYTFSWGWKPQALFPCPCRARAEARGVPLGHKNVYSSEEYRVRLCLADLEVEGRILTTKRSEPCM